MWRLLRHSRRWSPAVLRFACMRDKVALAARTIDYLGGNRDRTHAAMTGKLQRDPPAVFGGPVARVVDLDRLVGQRETGTRLPPERHGFHEVLDLLQVAARPFLLEADELPAGLPVDLLGDVDAADLRLVGQVAGEVVVRRDVGKQRAAAGVGLDH